MRKRGILPLAKTRLRKRIFRAKSLSIVCLFALSQMVLHSLSGPEYSSDQNAVLASIYDYELDLTPPGTNSFSCIQVHSDGRFHMESRMQRQTGSNVEYVTYDAVLNPTQIEQLNKIIVDPSLRALPDFVRPKTPATKYLYKELRADLVSNKKPRTVGYSIWKSHGVETSGSSLETAPEDIRRTQLASEAALAPLAKWFQDLRKMKFQPSNSSHTACSID